MRSLIFLFMLFFTTVSGFQAEAQTYSIDIDILNQPEDFIHLEAVSGDNTTIIDSVQAVNGKVHFELPNDARPGIYRLIFGKTGYARVMDEDPQLLDFIFNSENVQLKTDFKNPQQSVRVIQSEENEVYFEFLSRLREYENLMDIMEKEVDLSWQKGDSAKANTAANEFNRLQLDWDLKVVQTVQQNSGLFASKLIELKRTPLKDAFLLPDERTEIYRKEFLQLVEFTDESLIYSTAYTDKIFDFLKLFNQPGFSRQQRVDSYKTAVKEILSKTGTDEKVDTFIIGYLLHGFQLLGMKEVIDVINEQH